MTNGIRELFSTVNPRRLRTSLRPLAAVVLVLLMLVGVAGCGNRDDRIVSLRFVSWGNEIEQANLGALIDEFESNHPNIKVRLEIVPWTRVLDKVMIATAGGRPPDVARVSSQWSAQLAAKGLLEPLDTYVERDNYDLEDFYQQAIEGWSKYKGVLYSVPTDIDVHAMYYNKTMFDKHGESYPDWSWDWDKYLEVARKLTCDLDGDNRLDQWGCATDYYWQSYVYANGGTILDPDRNKCTLDQSSAYDGIQFMADLVNRHRVAPRPEETAQVGNTRLFTSGRIGMFVSGSWAAELVFKDNIKDFEYDVAPIPTGPAARITFIGGAAYAILSRSKHKDEAWELVKWMTGKQYQTSRAVQSQIIPSRKSVARSDAYLKLDKPPKHREVFLDMIEHGRSTPYVSCSPEMEEIIRSELDRVMLGQESAKTACEKVTPIIDQLLRQRE